MPRSRALGIPALLSLALAASAQAQRAPVLQQIKVPHHYYYREMYLPQVTSGASAAAWSPDGRELVYSMQGSLWRQALDSKTAQQLTDGPGYDHQPDWSPDGRFIAYASYRDDAVELWILEAASGRRWALTSNGAVNVEPRFSPDGKRVAFVSTLFNQRFHVHTLELTEGKAGAVTRLTEDHESDQPRYYYGRFDHYLSPSWSPDGREILLVSNRNRIWGTGGFWRMRAEPGAPMREVHFEETNWRARPDWSHDGKRVAYASYLGGQWHQIWTMTAEGGDVFPLGYGDFDATAPRWSPDGRRIAYVSNQTGNTSLWVMEVPGGGRRLIEAQDRQYLGPVGKLVVTVTHGGREVPARVSVRGKDGRSFAPDGAWRHADEAFDRAVGKFEYGYYHWSPEAASLTLPAGEFEVEVMKGLEYRPVRRSVRIDAGGTERLEVRMERLDDLPAKGWWSGDLHVHMNYGGAYRNTPPRLVAQARAEDVHVVENLIVNKEQRVPDVAYFDGGRVDPASVAGETLVVHGQEYHTSYWGHTGLLGLTDHLVMPPYAAYANTAAASLFPHNAWIADNAHAQGGLVGYVHPYDATPDPKDLAKRLTHEFPVDVALGKVDYYEAVGFVDDYWATQAVWYKLLNCGFRIAAGAGTDAMANYASLRGPIGMNRVFVKSGSLGHAQWLAALKAGRSFATNGPLLELSLGGKEIGDVVQLAKAGSLEVLVAMRSIVAVDRLQVVGNGEVVAEIPLTGERTEAATRVRIKIPRSGWYLLRAFGEGSRHPVLDLHPMATTSPIYVEVGGAPVRSKPDALYFGAWVDRLREAAAANHDYNSDAERSSVLETLAAARRVFAERASDPTRR